MMSTGGACSSGNRLAGKRVLVTGAGRGIGRAIALMCRSEGAMVAVTSRTRSELDETASEMRQGLVKEKTEQDDDSAVLVVESDLTDQAQVEAMVDAIADRWGTLDILFNNAGTSQPAKGPSQYLPAEDLERLLKTNVVAVHRVTSAVLRREAFMSAGGHIVNISSRAGKVGLPNYSFYVASKFAIEGYSASLAAELKDRNISVNTLSPGMVNTRSFPKEPGRPGVRKAESIYDGLFAVLESGKTGHYLHVDELDSARSRGLGDSAALKPINEPKFDP